MATPATLIDLGPDTSFPFISCIDFRRFSVSLSMNASEQDSFGYLRQHVCTSPFYAEEGWWATHIHGLPRVKHQTPQESVFRFIPSFYPQVLVRHDQHATGGKVHKKKVRKLATPIDPHTSERHEHLLRTQTCISTRMHCRRGPQSGQKDESGDSRIGLYHIRHSVSPQ